MSTIRYPRLKRALGPGWVVRLRCLARGLSLPRWGNLRRLEPFSRTFGMDRGTAVDRHYLDAFLTKWQPDITGDVLEIQAPGYARRHGHALGDTHSVDIMPDHHPTYVCDLAKSQGVIPSDRYDCFLLPNTLCVFEDIEGCLREALRVVKPGGVILATSACFVPMAAVPDYWRMSPAGWRIVAERAWPGCEVEVEGHGNVLAAVAAMLGLAREELTPAELDVQDPLYPVLITLRCRKPVGGLASAMAR